MSVTSSSSSHQAKGDGRSKQKMAATPWFSALLKRSVDRSKEEVSKAFLVVKERKEFQKFHPNLLHQMCVYAHYDRVDKNVIVIRQGDSGTNWYMVVSGTLDVFPSEARRKKPGSKPLLTLEAGSCFGESILTTDLHPMSIVTSTKVELLRLDVKDFKSLWENYKDLMEAAVTQLMNLTNLTEDMKKLIPPKDLKSYDTLPSLGQPITLEPSDIMTHAGWVLRTVLLSQHSHMIRDRKYYLRTYRRCLVGAEMVDWALATYPRVDTRELAVAMCQSLVEEGVLMHVCQQHAFEDRYLFYRFSVDSESKAGGGGFPSDAEIDKAQEDLQEVMTFLYNSSPDALLRCILRKASEDRSQEDIETIYDEFLSLKPLSHLSGTVKRELASVIGFEAHTKAGTVLFNQGDEGQSWYIVLRGSVNVAIHGKGVVCVLNEGEDFGKLALMNDAPRAATIILREDNCHFLRVDKDDFNRILRDVEANTVRLKEHGQDVLVLEKIPGACDMDGSFQANYKYSVMAGTAEKVLEYLLETKMDRRTEQQTMDTFLDDFLLSHIIFFPEDRLCKAILGHYQSTSSRNSSDQEDTDFLMTQRRGAIHFVLAWHAICQDKFSTNAIMRHFIETLVRLVSKDCVSQPGLMADHEALLAVCSSKKSVSGSKGFRKKTSSFLTRRGSARSSSLGDMDTDRKSGSRLKGSDDTVFKVYCADHTYTTIKLTLNASVGDIVTHASDKLCLGHDPVLCEVKSNGERVLFQERDRCISLTLSLNGRLFIAPREHLDALTPLPEQEGPTSSTLPTLELMSTKELANEITAYDWDLFTAFNEEELIVKVFKYPEFPNSFSANLDHFLFHFNELQYWVVTEMVLVSAVGKRVQLLRKFTKLAQHCKNLKNLNAFFAIMAGLSNIGVSRLSQTWEKLPGKVKKLFSELECLMDPARNHRAYRTFVSKLAPPVIPFMPLLLKDLTFIHEGNKTYYDSMVNMEKMQMIGQALRTVRFYKKLPLELEQVEGVKSPIDIRAYLRSLSVIDNQRILTNLSHKCEPRKT